MKHQATFSQSARLARASSLPDGHLERINALQAQRGKPALTADQILATPVRLFGNELTSYFTRVPDADLRALAEQINADGGPMLSAHVTDDTPIGSFYMAGITEGPTNAGDMQALGQPTQVLYLDAWAYWLNDEEGQRLARLIDGGIINEASIGYFYDEARCSITGASYWYSPYYAGNVYDVVDPETGESTQKLCFIWTTGDVEFAEGSLVYKGAYPGTKVGGGAVDGGSVAARAGTPLISKTHETRFQLAASKDLQAVFTKAPAAGEGTPNPPPSTADTKGEESVKLSLKLSDGSVKELDPSQLQATLDQQVQSATERGAQAERERIATRLGIEPKDAEGEGARLASLSAEAVDGRQYRADLLSKLHALTLSVEGNDPKGVSAADRAKRIFGAASIEDIRDEVERLEAKRDAALPNARLSVETEEVQDSKPRPRDLDAV